MNWESGTTCLSVVSAFPNSEGYLPLEWDREEFTTSKDMSVDIPIALSTVTKTLNNKKDKYRYRNITKPPAFMI